VERWATFDCYGTLVDWRSGIRTELDRLFGSAQAPVLLERYFALEPAVQQDGNLSYRAVLARTLAELAAEARVDLPADEEDALGRSLPSWPVFADVPPALTEARSRGWRLAMLSNTDREFIDASIVSIDVPFDLAVVASEIGSYKPALRHWEVFRERVSRDAAHVHVAQSLFHDIAPANTLALPSVWINRLGERPGPQPSRELPDLTGLADVLDELVAARPE
jgi:2-haloacid dehalogenase